MFIFSVKASRTKLIVIGFLIFVAATAAVLIPQQGKAAAKEKSGYNLSAANAEERIAFLKQFGWELKTDPVEVVEVLIPEEFDETYQNYNKLQKEQGFDLSQYAGVRVKRWTYQINNYPNQSAGVYANLLILEGKVIGGDVCSTELSGFMQGFAMPGAGQVPGKTEKPETKS